MQLLSKEQLEAVKFNDGEGAVLVEAAAGSGKTRLLTERVRYLLTEKKEVHFSVLCLTFTNKAAEEMKDRLASVKAVKNRAFIGNFHEFCLGQVIAKQKREIGFVNVPHIFNDDDKRKVIENIFLTNEIFKGDYVGLEAKEQRKRLDGFLEVISEAKRKLVTDPDNQLKKWSEKRKLLFSEYNERMFNQSAIDYDDIILLAYRILTERPAIANLYRRRYKYILIDEAQDLNYSQYQFLKSLCGSSHDNIMMVGDPNQAIYSFNGASVKYMQEYFVEDFAATKLKISKNYRSSDAVLSIANFVKSSAAVGDNFFKGELDIVEVQDEKEEADYIINQVLAWQRKGQYQEKEVTLPISLSDIAVIARNRYVFKVLQQKLSEHDELKNSFYLRQGSTSLTFESRYMSLFDLGLRIIVNPLDVVHFRQLCKDIESDFIKSSDRREFLLALDEKCLNDQYDKEFLMVIVTAWEKVIEKPNALRTSLNLILTSIIGSGNISETEQLKVDYDVSMLLSSWETFQRNTNPAQHNISNFRHFLALNSIPENENGLTLSTIHAAKGLEYEIVIVMGMNEGVLPSYRAISKSELETEKNTAYVAITRAKKCLYITVPQSRLMPWGSSKAQHISRFIKDYNSSVANT